MALKLVAEIKVTDVHAVRIFSDIDRLKKGVRQMSRIGVDRAIVRATNKSLLKTRTRAQGLPKNGEKSPVTLVTTFLKSVTE